MECLQYSRNMKSRMIQKLKSFKPCYKWNAFNTGDIMSIIDTKRECFKPCYKWNAFNTINDVGLVEIALSFKPCYKWNAFNT